MLANVRLQKFRSYRDTTFEFSEGVNIVVGPNASGKTNLLEALLVLARGKSFRTKDMNLISFNSNWSRIDVNFLSGQKRTIKLFSDKTPTKTIEINSKIYKRLPINQMIPVVLFEPNHLQLLSGGSDKRRDYMDDLLSQTINGYSTVINHYKRTVSQRNRLLKQSPTKESIFPWNIKLSQLAGQIIKHRVALKEEINSLLPSLYKKLSKTDTDTKLDYKNTWRPDVYETGLLRELENRLKDDIDRGFTSVGPHREDLVVLFEGVPAQETASRGEVRTAILALKIVELGLIEKSRGETPILLLDDVFSELDGKRRHALTSYLEKYQTFITTTDADLVVKNFTQNCNIIALV